MHPCKYLKSSKLYESLKWFSNERNKNSLISYYRIFKFSWKIVWIKCCRIRVYVRMSRFPQNSKNHTIISHAVSNQLLQFLEQISMALFRQCQINCYATNMNLFFGYYLLCDHYQVLYKMRTMMKIGWHWVIYTNMMCDFQKSELYIKFRDYCRYVVSSLKYSPPPILEKPLSTSVSASLFEFNYVYEPNGSSLDGWLYFWSLRFIMRDSFFFISQLEQLVMALDSSQ